MGIKDIVYGAASSVRKRLYDTFDRTDQSGLGRATDGSLWRSVRGTFNISSNGANSNSDSNYPISVIDMPSKNATVTIKSAAPGNAASIWVTDSGNWFSVGLFQQPEDCNCAYATQYVAGNFQEGWYYFAGNFAGYYTESNPTGNYTCNAFNGSNCNNYANTCNAYGGGGCSGYNATFCAGYYGFYNAKNKTYTSNCTSYGGGSCKSYYATFCTSSTTRCSGSWNSSTCKTSTADWSTQTFPYYNAGTNYSSWNNSYSYTYLSCQTCYPQYIRVLQSVANTVSTVASWLLSTTANSFKVNTSGQTITVSAYSDANTVSQIGSNLVYTATGAALTTAYGISIIPSTTNQSYSVASVEVTNP
jgi:hypothetical protein